jgi:pimeloyl-ACP methyl ester carboxylesterase
MRIVEHDDLPLAPPPSSRALREAFGVLELPRLLLRAPHLARQPRGNGEPVVVLPGYGAGDASTLMLRSYLRLLGYDARGWMLGRNTGDVRRLLPRVLANVATVARESKTAVRLVGWSLGGYIAREAARERPDLVDRVITFGSPVVGGPKYTLAAHAYRRRGFDLDAIEAAIHARNDTPLTTPVTAIYSRNDGIVAWQACIDRHCATVEHVEVSATHLGFGFSPEVYEIVAQRLAAPRNE